MRWVPPDQVRTHSDLSLFPIEDKELRAVTKSMQERGFDQAEPLVVWDRKCLVVDGHTRLEAARRTYLTGVYVDERPFEDFQAALDYAIARQRDRRNLSRQQLNAYVARVVRAEDHVKPQGQRSDLAPLGAKSHGKSASETAAKAGTSVRTVERTRKVLADGDGETKRQLLDGELSASAAYRVVREAETAKADSAPFELETQTVVDRPGFEILKAYSTEQWNALTTEERGLVIAAAPDGGTFNRQDTDNIEWAQWSWNPITGCLHNCPYCYARDIANRFYEQKFAPTLLPAKLAAPRHVKVPERAKEPKTAEDLGYRNVFTCSMADLFGKWVPQEWIEAVLDQVRFNPQWNFLFLTKFPVRLAEFEFPDNAWVGTTVDCQARVKNAERSFAKVHASVKWLSLEPLLEPLQFESLEMFDWVVLGGATSSNETPDWIPPRRWVENIEWQAHQAGCMRYEKTNLGVTGASRLREYPGFKQGDQTLPKSLAYLPSIEHGN